MNEPKFAFPYFGHGTSYFKEKFNCLIWFKNNSAAAALAGLKGISLFAADIPFDVDQADDAVILIHLQENCEYEIKAHYNAAFRAEIGAMPEDTDVWSEDKRFLPDALEWRKFNEEFDAALAEAHRACPILFVIKLSQPGKKYGTFSKWHDASLDVFHEQTWPALKSYLAGESKNAMKPALVERFNTLVNTAVSAYLKKCKNKTDRQQSHLEMVDFLCTHHLVYHDEEYNPYFKWMEYEEHVSAYGELLEKILPQDKRAVPLLQRLSPYTQLVSFSGCDYPYLLLFDDPAAHLKGLLAKIEADKKDILSEYLRLANNLIYDWYCDGNTPMNRELVDALSDLTLACDPVGTLACRDVMDRWAAFGEWGKILTHMKTEKYIHSYLLQYEKPAEYLKEFMKAVPKEYHAGFPPVFEVIAVVVAKTKPDEKRYGWNHDMAAIARAIKGLAK